MTDSSRFDDVTPGGLIAAAVAAGASTAVELALPNVHGLDAGVAVAVQALSNIAGKFLETRRRRAGRALRHASEFSGLSMDELTAAIMASPARADLTMLTIDAAVQTRLDEKIQALGRAIAAGAIATDEAVIDAEQFIVKALAQIETPHIRVLQIVARPRSTNQGKPGGHRKSYITWGADDIALEYPQAGVLAETICAELASVGALNPDHEPAWNGGTAYRISPFGRRILDMLDNRATGSARPDPTPANHS